MAKPSSKPSWATTGDKTEPSGSKKATGWLKLEKPPYQFMNWLFSIMSQFIDYLSGNAQYNIIVGGDSDERDYATMAAYIADSPTAGDRVLIKADEVLTATLIIPDDIEVTMLKGNKFTLTTNFSPIVQFGDNVKTKGDFRVENSDTGTIAKGFSINDDNDHHDNLVIENKSTGTVTDGVYIEASAEGNHGQARSINSGGGTITNDLTDNSGNDENHVTVKGDAGISRSRGAKKFDTPELITPTIADLTNAQHAHADAPGGGDLGFFPSATKMVFFQAAAPTGWTQDTSQNNKALRVVSGAGGGSGGTHGISTGAPDHTHTIAQSGWTSTGSQGGGYIQITNNGDQGLDTVLTTGNPSAKFAPLYVDVIICSKD